MAVRVACAALVLVAVIAVIFNPSLTGIGFAILVLVGACTVWYLGALYEAEKNKRG